MEKTYGINIRKAVAGIRMLEGAPMNQALIEAGFKPSTARNPARNGLSVERCLAETRKLPEAPSAAKLVNQARRALSRRLQAMLDASDAETQRMRPGEVAKIVEVVERYHGAGAESPTAPRAIGERIAWLQALMEGYREARQHVDGPQDVGCVDSAPISCGQGESDNAEV